MKKQHDEMFKKQRVELVVKEEYSKRIWFRKREAKCMDKEIFFPICG
ncbi:hypothetical protein [Bacillus cereus]|nr:hypothetical protein [Bacillus cereus]